MHFNSLNLSTPILKALQDRNYDRPTPIQEKAIPKIMARKDLMATAQTGTGKTAAFSIPIIQNLLNDLKREKNRKRVIKALIVTPTRELAIQIEDNIKAYSKYTPLRQLVIYGGVKQGRQVQALKGGIDILVATPGRLLDLIGQRFVDLRNVSMVVLDEADQMLDMGFIHDIKKILGLIPDNRQSMLFSATMPNNIIALSKQFLRSPEKIQIAPEAPTTDLIKQYVYYTEREHKRDLLLYILEKDYIYQALIFTRTKFGADKLVRLLNKRKFKAAAIHGNKSQNQRQQALNQFKKNNLQILVATDIAARGIDIHKLSHVINFDIPNISETYVHRIGRVGRAGEEGIAISLCERIDNGHLRDIEKLIGKKVEIINDHPFPQEKKEGNNDGEPSKKSRPKRNKQRRKNNQREKGDNVISENQSSTSNAGSNDQESIKEKRTDRKKSRRNSSDRKNKEQKRSFYRGKKKKGRRNKNNNSNRGGSGTSSKK